MHKNTYWLILLGAVAMATLWHGYSAIRSVHKYMTLSAQTAMFASNWSYEEIASDTYSPRVIYHYRVGDAVFSGETLLTNTKARNPRAAAVMVDDLAEQRWAVWYDPSEPSRSSLQKSLPVQKCLSAITLLGVFAYLTWIGYSVGMSRS